MKTNWKKSLIISLLLAAALGPVRGADERDLTPVTRAPAAVGPPETAETPPAVSPHFYGIGLVLAVGDDGFTRVAGTQPGTAAAKNKQLKAGDRIVAVAEDAETPVNVTGMPLNELVDKIRGPEGTKVTLTLIPDGEPESARRLVKFVRSEIKAVNFTTGAPSPHHQTGARNRGDEAEHAPVQINSTGIHVGGSDPVDINFPDFGGGKLPGVMAMTSIVAIIAPFVAIICVPAIFFLFRYRRQKILHETLRAMIDKGVPIPPELIVPPECRVQRRVASDLRNGLVMLGIGVGVMLLTVRVGFILTLIGVAFLVTWKIEKKNNPQNPANP